MLPHLQLIIAARWAYRIQYPIVWGLQSTYKTKDQISYHSWAASHIQTDTNWTSMLSLVHTN